MSELDCGIELIVKHCHTKYSDMQIIESIDGSVSKRELQIPTDEKELKIKFSQEYKEFFKEYWKINMTIINSSLLSNCIMMIKIWWMNLRN